MPSDARTSGRDDAASVDHIAPPQSHRRIALQAAAAGGLACLFVLLLWAWQTVDPLLSEVDKLQREKLPRLELIQRAKYAELDASIALRNALLIEDAALSKAELRRFEAQRQAGASALESLRPIMDGPNSSVRFERALSARASLERVRQDAVERERQSWYAPGPAHHFSDAAAADLQAALDTYMLPIQAIYDHEEQRISHLVTEARTQADRVWWLLLICGLIAATTLLAVSVGWRLELHREVDKRDRKILSLDEQRRALVREVHHRIKNHLQGLLGLIEARRSLPTGDGQGLATLHGHVLALMSIHGLQSRLNNQVPLLELVRQQVTLVRAGFPEAELALSGEQGIEGLTVDAEQAVPVALVTAELIVNAIKHGASAPIAIEVAMRDGLGCIRVTNHTLGGRGFDWSTRRGLGTGLSLADSLLQGVGRIRQTLNDLELTMTMELNPKAS